MDLMTQLADWSNANQGLLQVIAMTVAALTVAYSTFYRRLASKTPDEPAAANDSEPAADFPTTRFLEHPAVAVLPFKDLSENADQQYLADGLAEELITTLSYWRRFPVIARGASFEYRERSGDASGVGRALGARYVLEGSVRRSGDRTRVTARLYDAELGLQLWTQRYDRNVDDLFALQDEIATEIVRGIEPELGRAETERAFRTPPENASGWDACLQASSHIHDGTREGFERARRLLDRALELDPESSLAHSLNALLTFSEGLQGWNDDPPRIMAKALIAARRAQELSPRDWLPTALLGITTLWVERDYDQCIALERKAIELNPSAASAYQFLGCILQFDGQPQRALTAHETASRLNPILQSRALALSDISLCHLLLGDAESAVRFARRAVSSDPANARARQRLVAALGLAGSNDAAGELEELIRSQPRFDRAYIDATYPFRRSEDRDRFLSSLAAAGWAG